MAKGKGKKPQSEQQAWDAISSVTGIPVAQLKAGVSAAAGAANEPLIYVGVSTYEYDRLSSRPRKTAPRDRAVPISEFVRNFYKLSQPELINLQERLWVGGFYGDSPPEAVITGDWDETSVRAYETVLTRAAAFYQAGRKVTPDDVLDMAARARGGLGPGGGGGAGGPQRAPFTAALPNPDDLRAVTDSVARETLGRLATEAEVKTFVDRFNAKLIEARRAAYDAAPGGGTVVDAPSAQTFAEQELRAANPAEAGAHDVTRVFGDFLELLDTGL